VIRFFVAGIPKAMSVGSFFKFKRNGAEHHMQGRRNTDWSTLVGQIGRDHAPPAPLEGPLVFVATFYVPMPASIPQRARDTAMPIKRPDLDNLVHKLTDRFNGVFWQDDSQLTDIYARKRYPPHGGPGVEILVAPVTNVQLLAQLDQVVLDLEPASPHHR
jgi:Holliday junction resolvase RusA-like endonuclease